MNHSQRAKQHKANLDRLDRILASLPEAQYDHSEEEAPVKKSKSKKSAAEAIKKVAKKKTSAKKEAAKKAAEKNIDPVVAQIEQTEEQFSDDTELIAVIAAAIAAYEGTSTDGFVVRSIRRR